MSRPMNDGEFKTIAPGQRREAVVVAERVDSDTPYVHILRAEVVDYVANHKQSSKGVVYNKVLTLTDSAARELIEDLRKALAALPTSK